MSAAVAPRLTLPRPAPAADPVRVCFMIDRLSRAGTESQLVALIRELDRTQVEPSLVLLDGEDDLSRALEPAGCPVIRLGVRRLVSSAAANAARRLRAFWREQRPDVLQAYFLDAAYFGAPLAKLCGIRKVLRVRNNLGYWLTPLPRALQRMLRRRGCDARLHYGLASGARLEAHAWVTLGATALIGGEEAARFREVAAWP